MSQLNTTSFLKLYHERRTVNAYADSDYITEIRPRGIIVFTVEAKPWQPQI